jgi:hypothetical protein
LRSAAFGPTKLRETSMGDAINSRPIPPKGVKKIARGWSEAETPGTIREEGRILEGCEQAIDLSHPFSLQDVDQFTDTTRGFRFAPTPGYLLLPLRGSCPLNSMQLLLHLGPYAHKNLAKKTRNYALASQRFTGASITLCASAVNLRSNI